MDPATTLSPSYKKNIFAIAVPAIFETLATTLASMIDSKMVSSMGTAAISAIAVTVQPRLFILCFFTALHTVLTTLVAIHLGKDDHENANRIFLTSLSICALAAVILGIAAAAAAVPIMRLCSGQEDTMQMSVTYFRIMMLGTVFDSLCANINSGLRGCGKTKVTFASNLISCVVNIFFNYLLIEGHWGFPALGITGAALATVIGFAAAMLFSIVYLLTADTYLSLSYCRKNRIGPSMKAIPGIFKLWKHTYLQDLMTRIGTLISSSVTARIGSFETSIYSLGMNWMNVNFAFGKGFQTAGVALVGRSLGAGKKDDIHIYSRKITRYSLVTSLLLIIPVVLLAAPYYRLHSDSEEFVRIGFFVNTIVAVISVFQIVKIAQTGLLQGLGNMKLPMIAATLSVTILQPIANFVFITLLDLGIWGVWLSIFLSQVCWMICTCIFYKRTLRNLDRISA